MQFRSLLNKQFPTLIGLLLLVGGIGAGVFLLGTGTGGFLPKASPESTPKRLLITNLTDSSFTVSFITDSSVPGYIKLGESSGTLDQTVQDDRDQLTGSTGNFTTHHITVHNLTPKKTYYFSVSTDSSHQYNNNGQPYSVTTADNAGSAPQALTIYGSVLTPAQTPAEGSIVYVSIEGAQPLSAIVKSSGSWAIPLSTARTTDLSSYVQTSDATQLAVFVQGKDGRQTSELTTTIVDAQPVEVITLGQNGTQTTQRSQTQIDNNEEALANEATQTATDSATRSLSQSTATESAQESEATSSSSLASKFAALGLNVTPEATNSVTLLNPANDKDVINSTQPEILGTAPANTTITVKVESDPVYTSKVTADENGQWSYTPPADLAPGEHTITLTYKDDKGATKTVKRTFIVLASASKSLPAFTATPSAKATASATPSPTPSPTSTASARVSQPSTKSGVPVTGVIENTFILLIAGFLLIGYGLYTWRRIEV